MTKLVETLVRNDECDREGGVGTSPRPIVEASAGGSR